MQIYIYRKGGRKETGKGRKGRKEMENMTNDSHSYFVFDEKWDHKTKQEGRRQSNV